MNGKRKKTSGQLMSFLISAVSLVLIILILTGGGTQAVVLAVTVVLTVLILATTGNSELLPGTLKAILSGIGRIVRP